jgi:hypothetical protein
MPKTEAQKAYKKAYNREYNRRYREKNRDKVQAYQAAWKAANGPPPRATIMEYQRRYADRPDPTRPEPEFCEICGGKSCHPHLCEDHNHNTGLFRGWICQRCNQALGLFKDNPETVRRALTYLET